MSVVAGLAAAALNTGGIGLWPPKLGASDLEVAAASTHVFIDTSTPSVLHRGDYPVDALVKRAELLGRVMISAPVLDRVGASMDVSRAAIGTGARSTANVPLALTEPGSEQRASDIQRSGRRHHIEVQARQETPVLDVYTRAPTVRQAERLGNAAVVALGDHLRVLAEEQGLQPGLRVRLRQLGGARGGVVNGGLPMGIAVLTFVIAFAVTFGALALLVRRRMGEPLIRRPRIAPQRGDDWPHTTRLLPWTFAIFLAVLWLVPFNDIELTMEFPIDLKFDRLVIPFVAVTWAVGLLVGGRLAPRFRLTWIHAAVAAFVLSASLSVIVDAGYLNQTLELEGSLKQLPVLISYVSLFVIACSAIRGTEIRAFLTYTLALAVLCAVGVIWEYRFEQNLFFDWSDRLLPGNFKVAELDTGAVDNIGRRMVRGPAGLPLEAVAMLAMALPVALVWVMQAQRWRGRILYGLGACLLLAAAFATYRKSALLAPVSVIMTVAYFRRRELLKLAPLALVLVIVIHIVAPGAIGKTTTQFDPGQLGVTTVSDRAADYDAVRPDLWTHLVFGRGWGSYDHATYRILDSELLHRGLEMGVVGLVAFVAMVASVLFCARKTIVSRDPMWSPVALVGAAAAVSFLVVSTLFDVLAFPHATYIFMYLAGLTAVAVGRREDDEAEAVTTSVERSHGGRQHAPGRGSGAPRRPVDAVAHETMPRPRI